jgi:hypothetical protein
MKAVTTMRSSSGTREKAEEEAKPEEEHRA